MIVPNHPYSRSSDFYTRNNTLYFLIISIYLYLYIRCHCQYLVYQTSNIPLEKWYFRKSEGPLGLITRSYQLHATVQVFHGSAVKQAQAQAWWRLGHWRRPRTNAHLTYFWGKKAAKGSSFPSYIFKGEKYLPTLQKQFLVLAILRKRRQAYCWHEHTIYSFQMTSCPFSNTATVNTEGTYKKS